MIPAPTISERPAAVARGSLAILGEHLLVMHSATDLDTVFTSATSALERLVSCDWASVSYSPNGPGGQRRFWSRHRADQERVSGPARQFYDQHPLWLEWQRTLSDTPAHMDRTISDSDLERRDIYHTVFKPLGIRRMLGSCMPDGIDVAFAMCRDSSTAFSDEDAALLDLISRHLALSVKRLRDIGKGAAYVRGCREPVSEYGLVALNAAGRVTGATAMARAMLREHFGEQQGGDLPRRVREWLAAGGREPMRVVGELSGLVLTYSPPRGSLKERRLLLTSTPRADRDGIVRALTRLGLTPREREVARWVAAGKTNPEIASILGMQPATAKKHVERILQKAGVENRASLIVALLEPQI